MSWAYADKPEMTAAAAEAYTLAGNDNDALVIPAELAFARVVEGAAQINSSRGQAASDPGWTYLAACTTYAWLFAARSSA